MANYNTAVIYHYFEVDSTYRENFIFFLNLGVNDTAQYFIYISGLCTVELLDRPNVNYFYIENKNHDFGAVVQFSKRADALSFKNYVFVNSSMRGPFLPAYYNAPWQDAFISKINDTTMLVGSSINTLCETSPISKLMVNCTNFEPPFTHVQTTAFAISAMAYRYLVRAGFYSVDTELPKDSLICYYELGLSQQIFKLGGKISSLLPTYQGFCLKHRKPVFDDLPEYPMNTIDPLSAFAFYGRTLSPIENIFLKTSRESMSEVELSSHTFTALVSHQSNIGELTVDGVNLMERTYHHVYPRLALNKIFRVARAG